MKTVKVSSLTNAALDWAVAKCEGQIYHGPAWTKYSTDWAQGGPIIEREGISINAHLDGYEWSACDYLGLNEQALEKPLEAAMRCYVASKLGETVEIPDELTQ